MLYSAATVAALLFSLSLFGGTLGASIGRVDNGTVRPLKTLDSILPRDKPGNFCGSNKWKARMCTGAKGTASWADVCSQPNSPDYYNVEGECDGGLICFDTVDADVDGSWDIHCLPIPDSDVNIADGIQTGVLYVDRLGSTWPEEFMVSAQLQNTLVDATITATVQGNGDRYAYQPSAALVASIRNTTAKGCQYFWENRYCVPTTKFILQADQWIDFTVGLEGSREFYVVYAIMGHNPTSS